MTRTGLFSPLLVVLALIHVLPAALAQGGEPPALGVRLRDAVAAALQAKPGAAVEAEAETARIEGALRSVVEVKVIGRDGKLWEVLVSGTDARILHVREETDADAAAELAAYGALLGRGAKGLEKQIARAEEVLKGTAVAAAFEAEDGRAACEVIFACGRDRIDVDLDATTLALIEIELLLPVARDAAPARAADEEEDDEQDEVEDDDELEDGEDRDAARAAVAPPGDVARFPVPTPIADGVVFSATVTHPYLPLSRVRYTVLEGDGERVVREVLDGTHVVAGVTCLVLAEKEYEDGELVEISRNYFAQDEAGNVWYFGEDVDDYEDGEIVGHDGAWLVGRDTAEPCLFMPADLEVGRRFRRENAAPIALEVDEIAAVDRALTVPAGSWTSVLVVRESDRTDRWEEEKFYARDVGLISENRELVLVRIGRPEAGKR